MTEKDQCPGTGQFLIAGKIHEGPMCPHCTKYFIHNQLGTITPRHKEVKPFDSTIQRKKRK